MKDKLTTINIAQIPIIHKKGNQITIPKNDALIIGQIVNRDSISDSEMQRAKILYTNRFFSHGTYIFESNTKLMNEMLLIWKYEKYIELKTDEKIFSKIRITLKDYQKAKRKKKLYEHQQNRGKDDYTELILYESNKIRAYRLFYLNDEIVSKKKEKIEAFVKLYPEHTYGMDYEGIGILLEELLEENKQFIFESIQMNKDEIINSMDDYDKHRLQKVYHSEKSSEIIEFLLTEFHKKFKRIMNDNMGYICYKNDIFSSHRDIFTSIRQIPPHPFKDIAKKEIRRFVHKDFPQRYFQLTHLHISPKFIAKMYQKMQIYYD